MKLKKYKLNELNEFAKKLGGKCATRKYYGTNHKYTWKCSKKHSWKASFRYVMSGYWCPQCLKIELNAKKIATLSAIAKSLNGKIISKEYHSTNSLTFWCKEHGRFKAKAQTIRNGSWCLQCKGKRISNSKTRTLSEIKEAANKLKWQFCSKEYKSTYEKYHWICPKKHKVTISWKRIRADPTDCPVCKKQRTQSRRAERYRVRLKEMKRIAKERNGFCLSTEFLGELQRLEWKCECGNIWKTTPGAIEKGSWCAKCNSGLGERLARTGLEQLFEVPFPPASLPWLRNPVTNFPMRLDGYNAELNLAFEHQGRQHLEHTPKWFHRKRDALKHQKQRDRIKQMLAQQNKLPIIFIPEMPGILSLDDFIKHVSSELVRLEIPIPHSFQTNSISWGAAYSSKDIHKLEFLHEHARKNGGQCLAKVFINGKTKYEFICKNKHKFFMTGNKVKLNRWCRKCAAERNGKMQRLPIEWFHEHALSLGGICKSKKYEKDLKSSYLTFNCGNGHKDWTTTAGSIRSGQWCPECGKIKGSLNRKATINAKSKSKP